MLVHIGAFAAAIVFARAAFGRSLTGLGWAFSLFALAEVSYMTDHLDWTVFLFAHTISEVLDLAAFAIAFVSLVAAPLARPSEA